MSSFLSYKKIKEISLPYYLPNRAFGLMSSLR